MRVSWRMYPYPFSDELSDAQASRAVVRTIRGRKRRMWDCLNSPVEYWTPWLKVIDMDAITKRAGIAALSTRAIFLNSNRNSSKSYNRTHRRLRTEKGDTDCSSG